MPVDFTSPQTVERLIQSLDTTWEALARSYPMDKTVQDETKRFRQWRDKIRSSLLSKFFPSTIAREYENWQHRYKIAFEGARKRHPKVQSTAPTPQAIIGPEPTPSPWVYAIVAGSVALGLVAIAYMRK